MAENIYPSFFDSMNPGLIMRKRLKWYNLGLPGGIYCIFGEDTFGELIGIRNDFYWGFLLRVDKDRDSFAGD